MVILLNKKAITISYLLTVGDNVSEKPKMNTECAVKVPDVK